MSSYSFHINYIKTKTILAASSSALRVQVFSSLLSDRYQA